ncbi:hypothetical protein C9I28_09650 [Pseudoduganella armeniaca]|uniref:Transposase n=1 Tax=Pseudoduganella armeniaca TaxID=2072590 RepID=A0A2R4C8M1_9BURK|nr:hypothetical protein C9I28_09650 [Pseudoduganella armeniaca]
MYCRGVQGRHRALCLAETINGRYKAESIRRHASCKTRETVELDTLEWLSPGLGTTACHRLRPPARTARPYTASRIRANRIPPLLRRARGTGRSDAARRQRVCRTLRPHGGGYFPPRVSLRTAPDCVR